MRHFSWKSLIGANQLTPIRSSRGGLINSGLVCEAVMTGLGKKNVRRLRAWVGWECFVQAVRVKDWSIGHDFVACSDVIPHLLRDPVTDVSWWLLDPGSARRRRLSGMTSFFRLRLSAESH